jgi:hypothetical protein
MIQVDADARCERCHVVATKCSHARIDFQEQRQWLSNASSSAKHGTFEASLLLLD